MFWNTWAQVLWVHASKDSSHLPRGLRWGSLRPPGGDPMLLRGRVVPKTPEHSLLRQRHSPVSTGACTKQPSPVPRPAAPSGTNPYQNPLLQGPHVESDPHEIPSLPREPDPHQAQRVQRPPAQSDPLEIPPLQRPLARQSPLREPQLQQRAQG